MIVKKCFGKLIPIYLVLCIQLSGHSQSPQGFSYQAVVRNGAGTPIADKTVGLKITIQDTLQAAYYTETHTPKSNAQGVISVTIGRGTKVGVNTFTSIPWQKGRIFIKAEIDPEGGTNYITMGDPAKLQSVPYALYAENAKEVVSLPNATDTDPIFVVKNKAGQVVFAVYQTGVRVYVEDSPIIKGARGGFAVGGLSQTKAGITPEYFRITSDSARINFNNPTVKGARGGFAVGGLSQVKGNDNNFMQLSPNNYLIGHQAGKNITNGLYNSFMGYQNGQATTIGSNNVFIGYQTGFNNLIGSNIVAIGNLAGYLSTSGASNVFIGDSAGYGNTSSYNVFLGKGSGKFNTGQYNAFMGYQAGLKNTSGSNNVFIGNQTGLFNTSGDYNTFLGYQSGFKSNSSYNTFTGYQSGMSNTYGSYNVFMGYQSGLNNIDGTHNVFIGHESGLNNTSGWSNNFIGQGAGYTNTTGTNDIFIGNDAGRKNTTSSGNTFIGRNSGYENTDGWGNTYLGHMTGEKITSGNNNLILGVNAANLKTSGNNNVLVGSFAGQNSANGSYNVFLGAAAGFNSIGSYNVFLGNNAGYSETGNNKLYIANSSGTPPLIYGDFSLQRVGINTITPGEALEVNGNIKATSFMATTSGVGAYKYNSSLNMTVPDYVFDKHFEEKSTQNPIYEMLDLTDLRKFINNNRHLPRVPSRIEIEKDGAINLQGLQMITLEKVEENTLYILQLEKISNDQQKQIEELKEKNKEIDALKAELEAIKVLLKK